MAEIRLERVSKVYPGGVAGVSEVSLDVRDGEFMVLLGPAGSGKSTVLRLIAGLERTDAGDIQIGERRVNDVDPRRRELALVFQQDALFPHMTVRDNLAFGMRLRRVPKAERASRIDGTAQLLGLIRVLDHKPGELSSAQRQRTALARALLRDPVAFLLDEPLAMIDASLRAGMRTELVKLHRQLGRTILHATHDQVEAMTLAERLCIMSEGRVVQVGPPMELYRNPANLFVAGFLASPPMNLVTLRMTGDAAGGLVGEAEGIRIEWPEPQRSAYASYRDRKVVLGFRPEDLWIEPYAPAAAPVDVTVVAVETLGPEVILVAGLPGMKAPEVAARLPPEYTVPPGTRQRLWLDPTRARLFDANTGAAIPPPVD